MDQLTNFCIFEKEIQKHHAQFMKTCKIDSYLSWINYSQLFANILHASSHVTTACRLDLKDEYLLHTGFSFFNRTSVEIIHIVKASEWKGVRPSTPNNMQTPKVQTYKEYTSRICDIALEKRFIQIYSYFSKVNNYIYLFDIFNFGGDLYQFCAITNDWNDWNSLPEEIRNLIL